MGQWGRKQKKINGIKKWQRNLSRNDKENLIGSIIWLSQQMFFAPICFDETPLNLLWLDFLALRYCSLELFFHHIDSNNLSWIWSSIQGQGLSSFIVPLKSNIKLGLFHNFQDQWLMHWVAQSQTFQKEGGIYVNNMH